jgi:radical SAM superfamily enzyme YgiQ (UPF0313 family)
MFGWKYRRKDPQRVIEEIDYCVKKFGIRNLYFMDLEFTARPSFAQSICEGLLDQPYQIEWCCQTRFDTVNKHLLALMKKAGCRLIHYGLESASQRILDMTEKRLQLEHCTAAIADTRRAGIDSLVFCNFGFPSETIREMELTIDFVIRINPTFAAFHLLVPYPGTNLASQIDLHIMDLPVHTYPSHVPNHSLYKLRKMQMKAYFRFFFRIKFFQTAVISLFQGKFRNRFKLVRNLVN